MEYISTRDKSLKYDFKQIFLAGLAADGGLFVPEEYPVLSEEKIKSFKNLSYRDLAYEICKIFISDKIENKVLKEIIDKTYNDTIFKNKAIAPLKSLDNRFYLLELFHGPTHAFKDFALQLMGHILDYFLSEDGEKAIIIGATSGDTGSAAISGCANCQNADIFILHPHNKTSEIQRKQMTTIIQDNVFNIALEGNFDDAQAIVKHIFKQQKNIKFNKKLIAVNSINWARIIGQIIYYFYIALKLDCYEEEISFSVPTGNFGDIFAGYVAKKMGLPINKLIIATNKNDILARFINNNQYAKKALLESLSPSMDIQISSNFERLLFDAHANNADKIADLMAKFHDTGKLAVDLDILKIIQNDFFSSSSNDSEIIAIMQKIYKEFNEVIDPHTATGVKSAYDFSHNINGKIVILATAHPAKFPQALTLANIKNNNIPANLANILDAKEKFTILANDPEKIINFIKSNSLNA
jgi:threonine synthase